MYTQLYAGMNIQSKQKYTKSRRGIQLYIYYIHGQKLEKFSLYPLSLQYHLRLIHIALNLCIQPYILFQLGHIIFHVCIPIEKKHCFFQKNVLISYLVGFCAFTMFQIFFKMLKFYPCITLTLCIVTYK